MGDHRCFQEHVEPLLCEIFRQAIPSHSAPAVPSEKIKETNAGPAPERKKRRAKHEAVAIIQEHGNHLVRILDQACMLRVMTGQAFGCLGPAIPARAP